MHDACAGRKGRRIGLGIRPARLAPASIIYRRALARVPRLFPAPGWVTMPWALSTTMTRSSWWMNRELDILGLDVYPSPPRSRRHSRLSPSLRGREGLATRPLTFMTAFLALICDRLKMPRFRRCRRRREKLPRVRRCPSIRARSSLTFITREGLEKLQFFEAGHIKSSALTIARRLYHLRLY